MLCSCFAQAFPRKAYDYVHIDFFDSNFPYPIKAFDHSFLIMMPADDGQGSIIHGLRVDADAVYPVILQDFSFGISRVSGLPASTVISTVCWLI